MKHSRLINIDGRSIAVFEKNSTAPNCFVFIHGHSSSSRVWESQWNSESSILQNYCFISIDLPGNGDSVEGSFTSKDYGPIGSAKLIIGTISEVVGNRPFALVGFSFGNNVIAEMIALGSRPVGIVMLSPCVVGQGYELEKVVLKTEGNVFLRDESTDDEIIDFLKSEMSSNDPIIHQSYFDDFRRVASGYRKHLFDSIGNKEYSDEVQVLEDSGIQCLVAFGENDDMFNSQYLNNSSLRLWNNKVAKLNNAGHFLPTDNAETVNNLLEKFAAELFEK